MREITVHIKRGIEPTVALVDDGDYAALVDYRWFLHQHGYAVRQVQRDGKNRKTLMHRQILGLRRGDDPVVRQVDHINGIKLDNRRENLRIVTREHNAANQRARKGKRGVYRDKERGLWIASAMWRGKQYHLGRFEDEEIAEAVVTGFWRGVDVVLTAQGVPSA